MIPKLILLLTISLLSFAASAKQAPNTISEFKGKIYFVVWYEGKTPLAKNHCLPLTQDDQKKFSKFKCGKEDSGGNFSDYSCSGKTKWEGKNQKITLMIFEKNSPEACKAKAEDYVNSFS